MYIGDRGLVRIVVGKRNLENRASYFSRSSAGVKSYQRTSTITAKGPVATIVAIPLNNTRTWESVVPDLSLEFGGRFGKSGRPPGVNVLELSTTSVVGIAAQIAKLQRSNVVVGDLEIGC
jgi:hypothetical protein